MNSLYFAAIGFLIMFVSFVYGDTNGFWNSPSDFRGGVIGSDEQDVTTNFTFINPVTVNNTVSVQNNIKIGETSNACTSSIEGSIRYNDVSNELEYCDGSGWRDL